MGWDVDYGVNKSFVTNFLFLTSQIEGMIPECYQDLFELSDEEDPEVTAHRQESCLKYVKGDRVSFETIEGHFVVTNVLIKVWDSEPIVSDDGVITTEYQMVYCVPCERLDHIDMFKL